MSKIKSCADSDVDRPPLRTKPPRIPPAVSGIQYNFWATNFRRDKQKGLTVNTVNLMIKHKKRPFGEQSRSELSASTPLSERFNLKLSRLK